MRPAQPAESVQLSLYLRGATNLVAKSERPGKCGSHGSASGKVGGVWNGSDSGKVGPVDLLRQQSKVAGIVLESDVEVRA